MDLELRQLRNELKTDPTLIFEYWNACKRYGIVTIETLITAVREIETILHREFYDLYWPLEDRRGLINAMDFRTPESTAKTFEIWVNNVKFLLTPCICKAPKWTGDCIFCGYQYPFGSSAERTRPNTILTKDIFIRRLNVIEHIRATPPPKFSSRASGGLPSYWSQATTWNSLPLDGNIIKAWAHEFFSDWRNIDEWKHQAHLIGTRALELIDSMTWPSASEVWDAFSGKPCEATIACKAFAENVIYLSTSETGGPFATYVPHQSSYCDRHLKSIHS